MTTPTPPPPAGAPQQQPKNTQGLVAMILGIVSIPLVCCLFLGIPVGIAAVILGVQGKKLADQGAATNRGQALAGIITGAVAIGLGVILVILNIVARNIDLPMYTP